jgi:hypothetical protein
VDDDLVSALDQIRGEFYADMFMLATELQKLAALVAELSAISSEDARGVTIADSEYAFINQKLLKMQGTLNHFLANFSPEARGEEE